MHTYTTMYLGRSTTTWHCSPTKSTHIDGLYPASSPLTVGIHNNAPFATSNSPDLRRIHLTPLEQNRQNRQYITLGPLDTIDDAYIFLLGTWGTKGRGARIVLHTLLRKKEWGTGLHAWGEGLLGRSSIGGFFIFLDEIGMGR